MTLRGSIFKNDNIIASDKYRPLSTTIPFNIEAPNVMVSLTLPKWSAHSLLASAPVETLGRFERLRLEGSYQYFSDRRVDNIERLRLHFIVRVLLPRARQLADELTGAGLDLQEPGLVDSLFHDPSRELLRLLYTFHDDTRVPAATRWWPRR